MLYKKFSINNSNFTNFNEKKHFHHEEKQKNSKRKNTKQYE